MGKRLPEGSFFRSTGWGIKSDFSNAKTSGFADRLRYAG
jgi:hypothetical protein